ncbi:MAG: YbhB/YbcL family Raf kinase inhibitor-like protein [Phycisphaerales bacterium]|nr:MAG: YbhB/YbcL family Raf kinase inhibitor-like protein [Phycisphaerales bacterium]
MRFVMFCVMAAVLCGLGLAGCQTREPTPDQPAAADNDDGKGGAAMTALEVTSPAFKHESAIPAKYTCDGEDISPPLSWSAGPEGTASYALIMDDPDAPGRTWVHWVVFNLTEPALAEGVSAKDRPAAGLEEGDNSWRSVGYGGPCPPSGTHRYFFKVYALDTMLSFVAAPTKENLHAAMKGHVLAQGELMGTYARKR